MNWLTKRLEKFRNQNIYVIWATVAGRFSFGFGLGAVLAGYFPEYNWQLYGWLLIILAGLLHIPITYAWFK